MWWGVEGQVTAGMGRAFTWLYVAIAFGVLPWFVPWAVQRLEPVPVRRMLMAALGYLGLFVSAFLMVAAVRGPVAVVDGGNYLAYQVPLTYGGLWVAFYIAATCGSLLLSSDQVIAGYGLVNLVAVIGLAVLLHEGVISLWCVWAAVTSTAIALHLRRTDARRHHYGLAPGVG